MPVQPSCDCCAVNTFSTREAEGDLKRYRDNGPDRTTRALVDAIRAQGIDGATLLDVGGGIGAIQLELLAAGLASAQSVDASEGYVAVASAEATRRGYADRTSHRLGSLQALAGDLDVADVVTLDRVVCCDPDLPSLLDAVTRHARQMVGLVYPRVTTWNRIAGRVMAVVAWMTRDDTRWRIHPDEEIDGRLRAAGFERRDVDRTFVWQVALYVKAAATSATAGPGA